MFLDAHLIWPEFDQVKPLQTQFYLVCHGYALLMLLALVGPG